MNVLPRNTPKKAKEILKKGGSVIQAEIVYSDRIRKICVCFYNGINIYTKWNQIHQIDKKRCAVSKEFYKILNAG